MKSNFSSRNNKKRNYLNNFKYPIARPSTSESEDILPKSKVKLPDEGFFWNTELNRTYLSL